MGQICVFTLPGCEYCYNLKRDLKKLSIPFIECSIVEFKEIWDQIVEQVKDDALPTVYIKTEGMDQGPLYMPGFNVFSEEEMIEKIKSHI